MNYLISALSLIIHSNIPVLDSAHISLSRWRHAQHRLRSLKFRESYLIHLIVNVAVSRRLKYLMPLFGNWVKLIHVIGATVGIGACKQIE